MQAQHSDSVTTACFTVQVEVCLTTKGAWLNLRGLVKATLWDASQLQAPQFRLRSVKQQRGLVEPQSLVQAVVCRTTNLANLSGPGRTFFVLTSVRHRGWFLPWLHVQWVTVFSAFP